MNQPEYEVKQEIGHPEAAMQAGMFDTDKEVRPVGKGEVVQESLDDWLKYKEVKANG